MIIIAEQGANALGGTYPPATQEKSHPEPNPLTAENSQLKEKMAKLEADLQGMTEENDQLKKKLVATESFIKIRYAEQIADAKIGRKMLKKDDRDAEIKKLKEYSQDTLKVLSEELSQMKVELTADEPAPIAPPAQPIVTETPEQIAAREEKEMRQQLFGHSEPADEFYAKQYEAQLSRRMM